MKMVALIPARAGSKRIPGKNIKWLAGHPLIAYTVAAARESGVFSNIVVSTDDVRIARVVADECPCLTHIRSEAAGADDAPDIMWVREVLSGADGMPNAFCILRPTSPFRTAATIRRAYDRFWTQEVHSMRAVQPVKEHPGKMWLCEGPGHTMKPYGIPQFNDTPDHSRPTQTLRKVYIQNASLEMAWTFVVQAFGTISGNKVAPFFTEGYEGFDLNTMDDWREAERLIQEGLVALPSLPLARV